MIPVIFVVPDTMVIVPETSVAKEGGAPALTETLKVFGDPIIPSAVTITLAVPETVIVPSAVPVSTCGELVDVKANGFSPNVVFTDLLAVLMPTAVSLSKVSLRESSFLA